MQVFIKSKIAKQFMYNWLQLVKILSKFYRKKSKAVEGDPTTISFSMTLGRFLAYEHSDQKLSQTTVTPVLTTTFLKWPPVLNDHVVVFP